MTNLDDWLMRSARSLPEPETGDRWVVFVALLIGALMVLGAL